MEHYIFPPTARRKLRAAQELPQTAYIFGATGYGKTELVRQFLGKRRHLCLSCADGLWDSGVLPPPAKKRGDPAIVVIDDLHRLQSEDKRQEVIALARRSDVWLVLISRSPVPSWLMPCYVERGFLLIQEPDLRLGKREVEAYLKTCGVTLDGEALEQTCQIGQGNAYAVRQVTLLIQAGVAPGPELRDALWDAMSAYVERCILNQWDSELVEFLMQVSVVDEFTLELAEMISGSCRAAALLDKAAEAGGYGFLRLVSEEGAAARELLRQIKPETLEDEGMDRAWLKRLFRDTEDMALRYPVYLSARLTELPDFSENALAVLRLQADGLSNPQISERLGMNLETVKYHVKSTYKKLGVSGKAEAVLAARNLGLI